MSPFKSFLKNEFEPFDRDALWSPAAAREGVLVFLCWALPAIALALVVDHYSSYLPENYLKAAISEGIGPHLWNVIAIAGLALVGLAFLFPWSRIVTRSAYHVLINTYAIGGLTFGLLIGQALKMLFFDSKQVEILELWLTETGYLILILQALMLNFSLWYLGNLMIPKNDGNSFIEHVTRLDIRLRIFGFCLFTAQPLILFVLIYDQPLRTPPKKTGKLVPKNEQRLLSKGGFVKNIDLKRSFNLAPNSLMRLISHGKITPTP